MKDRKCNLWVSTNHGISRFNPRTRQFRNFGPSDGLKIDEFNSDAAYLSANRYIADFSRLIRTILNNLSVDYIPLNKEMESLRDYLLLEYLRFGDKFDYSIEVKDAGDEDTVKVVPGLIQPFVENAIWHGVRGLVDRKGFVKIEISGHSEESLICTVEDDGIGRKLAEERKNDLPGKTSRGIGIVLERLKIINNLRKTNFRVKIEDLYPGREESGTRVIIDVPVKVD